MLRRTAVTFQRPVTRHSATSAWYRMVGDLSWFGSPRAGAGSSRWSMPRHRRPETDLDWPVGDPGPSWRPVPGSSVGRPLQV